MPTVSTITRRASGTGLEQADWDVLADDPAYPARRLSGNPPAQRQSKIDYLIVSKGRGGLAGEEIT